MIWGMFTIVGYVGCIASFRVVGICFLTEFPSYGGEALLELLRADTWEGEGGEKQREEATGLLL